MLPFLLGWIINTSSILGYVGADHTAAYCASKGAVLNFTRAAALDCAPHRIHVNGVAPGYTESSMTGPIWGDEKAYKEKLAMHPFGGRLGQPDDLAKACVFLASEDAQWVTGVSIVRVRWMILMLMSVVAYVAGGRRVSGEVTGGLARV